MSIAKISGLAVGGFAKSTGKNFNSEYSMLIEELVKGQNALMVRLESISKMLKGQVIGLVDAAKIALNNSLSTELTQAERRNEIIAALRSLELCYGQINNIDELSHHKGEVAFMLAMCNILLDRNQIAGTWLEKSEEDFQQIILLSPKYHKRGTRLGNELLMRGSASIGIGGALAGLVGAIAAPPVVIIGLLVGGSAGIKHWFDSEFEYETYWDKIGFSQSEIAENLTNIQQVQENLPLLEATDDNAGELPPSDA
jgi:hypothetical protein